MLTSRQRAQRRYRDKNKDNIKDLNEHYRKANRDEINARARNWYKNHKSYITCDKCGSVYVKQYKPEHEKTKKHLAGTLEPKILPPEDKVIPFGFIKIKSRIML